MGMVVDTLRVSAVRSLKIVYFVVAVPLVIWSLLFAIYAPYSPWIRYVLLTLMSILLIIFLIFQDYSLFINIRGKKWRFFYPWLIPFFVFFVSYFCYLAIQPVNDADWQISCSRNPTMQIDGDKLTITHLRDFRYRSETDFDARWLQKTISLNTVVGMDWVVSHWASDLIGHTMVAFRFENPEDNFVLSVETRVKKGQTQELLGGIYKNQHILWILGTENDLLRLRVNYRNPREDMYLYPLKSSPKETREVIERVAARVNQLSTHPEFYNTLIQNCTTSLKTLSLKKVSDQNADIRVVINGYSDQLAFENKAFADIHPDDSYVMYRAKHLVNLRLQNQTVTDSNFSQLIRQ